MKLSTKKNPKKAIVTTIEKWKIINVFKNENDTDNHNHI